MEGGPRRVHHSYIWLGGLKNALITLFVLGLSLAGTFVPLVFEMAQGEFSAPLFTLLLVSLVVLVGVFLVIGLFVLLYWLSWKHMSYELAPEQFNFYSGIFNKKRLHIPYQRVQSVDTRADIFQRLAGVCTLEIDTAGGSGNKAVLVPYLLKSDALALRGEIFGRKRIINNGGVIREDGSAVMADGTVVTALSGRFLATEQGTADTVVSRATSENVNALDGVNDVLVNTRGLFDEAYFSENAVVHFEMGLSNKELLLSGLSDVKNVAGALIAAIFGILAFASSWGIAVDFLTAQVEEQVANGYFAYLAAQAKSPLFFLQLLLPGIAVFICVYLVIAAFSALSSVLSYGGFKVRRRGSRIEVERGLLQRHTQGVDVDRVQLVRVEHGWIRRLFGYCRVTIGRIDSVSNKESNSSQAKTAAAQGMVVHPFLKASELQHFLDRLIPEFSYDCPQVVKPPVRAKRRAVLRGALWFNGGFWTAVMLLVCLLCVYRGVALGNPGLLVQVGDILVGFWPVFVILLIPVGIGAVRGLKWLKGSECSYGNGFIHMVNEGFTCKEVVIPRQKVQFSDVRMNPFQRVCGLRSLVVTTASGIGGTSERMWDFELEDAEAVQEWLRPKR